MRQCAAQAQVRVQSVVQSPQVDGVREHFMDLARVRPFLASFLVALSLCGAVPTALFLGFILFSALSLILLAIIVEVGLICVAGFVFLIVMSFVLAIAGGLTIPFAILWLGFNVYRGTPLDFPPFSVLSSSSPSSSSSSSNSSSGHKD